MISPIEILLTKPVFLQTPLYFKTQKRSHSLEAISAQNSYSLTSQTEDWSVLPVQL